MEIEEIRRELAIGRMKREQAEQELLDQGWSEEDAQRILDSHPYDQRPA